MKKHPRFNPTILSGIAFLILAVLFGTGTPSAAEDAGNAKKQYKSIQNRIQKQKKKIMKARKVESTTLDELHKVNRQLLKVSRDLRKYRNRLQGIKKDVRRVEAEMGLIDERIKGREEWMKRKLRVMHRHGRYADVLVALGTSEDFSQLLRRWRYLRVLAAHEKEAIEEYRKDLLALKGKQEDYKTLQSRLKKERERVARVEKDLVRDKEKKQKILLSVRKKRSSYDRVLKELLMSSRKVRRVIREASQFGQFKGVGFRKQRGRLLWPVRGKVAIPYGTTKDPRFETPVFRNGIYITAVKGTDVKSVHMGEVVYADWFKGYGQLVIVNHGGGYHSLYANLSEIFLKPRDIIDRGGNIGKVGASGMLERASLYFEIRYKGKALNPRHWLSNK
jgi:septal ring factor EnvC (AmiA/AmiB activator)